MSEDLHDIDDLFKKALGQHKEVPSPEVWEAIDKHLDKNKVVSISKKYNKLKWAAAALLVFSFGMAMYTLQTGLKNKELVKQNKIGNSQPEDPETIKQKKGSPGSHVAAPGARKNALPGVGNAASDDRKDPSESKAQMQMGDTFLRRRSTVGIQHPISKQDLGGAGRTDRSHTRPENNKPADIVGRAAADNSAKENKKPATTLNGNYWQYNRQQDSLAVEQKPADVPDRTKKSYVPGVPLSADVIPVSGENFTLQSPVPLLLNKGLNGESEYKNNGTKISTAKDGIRAAGNSSFFVSAFVSPEFVSFNVQDDHPRYREDNKNQIKNNEKPRSSLSYGIWLGYNTGKKWTLTSGLSVFSTVTDINTKTIYARPDNGGSIRYRLSCSAGSAFVPLKSGPSLIAGDSTNILSARNTLQYVSIPFLVRYTIGKGRLTVSAGAGFSANILSKGKIETLVLTAGGYESSHSNKIEGLKPAFFNSQLSLGADYHLNTKVAINFTPSAKIALSSINKNEPVKTRMNSLGLSAGITINL